MNLKSRDKAIESTTGKLVVFEDKQIRRVLHNGEWWFVVKDIVEILTDTSNSTDYIKKMRERLLSFRRVGTNCHPPSN